MIFWHGKVVNESITGDSFIGIENANSVKGVSKEDS